LTAAERGRRDVAKKRPDPLSFDFGFNKRPRKRPSGKRTEAQKAAYARYFGKGKKK
jgi:hypothetical protein